MSPTPTFTTTHQTNHSRQSPFERSVEEETTPDQQRNLEGMEGLDLTMQTRLHACWYEDVKKLEIVYEEQIPTTKT